MSLKYCVKHHMVVGMGYSVSQFVGSHWSLMIPPLAYEVEMGETACVFKMGWGE